MFRKTVKWVLGFCLVTLCHSSAFADQSIAYQRYFNEGLKAYNEHDDQKALRCFKLAQIFDSSDKKLSDYIAILEKRASNPEPSVASIPIGQMTGFHYYLKMGIEAFHNKDIPLATHYFRIAEIFNPYSQEVEGYLEKIGQEPAMTEPSVQEPAQPRTIEVSPVIVQTAEEPAVTAEPATTPSASTQPASTQPVATSAAAVATPPEVPQAAATQAVATQEVVPVVAHPLASQPSIPEPVITEPIRTTPYITQPTVPKGTTYIPTPNIKMPIAEISLDQLTNSGQGKPILQIEYKSSVILDGRNIQRFLIVDEGFIGVSTIGLDKIKIDAQKIGTTFLHIWDDNGRHTIYIEVVFPKSQSTNPAGLESNGVTHSQPFLVTYTNDWSTYYSGNKFSNIKRQSYDFNHTLTTTGETPYGFFDASTSYSDDNGFSKFDSLTVGLSQIPLEGTDNLNLRGFDALRYSSPLTMPGTRMEGAFADVDLFDDLLGVSFSYGKMQAYTEQASSGLVAIDQTNYIDSYINATKLTLLPKSTTDQLSLNYATGYGPDHFSYLTDRVYSIEGMHKFNDFLTFSSEEASDSHHDATLASLKWLDGRFSSGLNFRNIDKNYSTISSLPADQGETGADWVSNLDWGRVTASSFFEAYQDHLYDNPQDPRALNYDANSQVRTTITDNLWSDTDYNYIDTSGEASPSRSYTANERISRSFGIWNSLKATVYGGVGYQLSHSSDTTVSDYDREEAIAGIQVPLTKNISSFANYEYDWLHQPFDGGISYPNVINAGFGYQKEINSKLSFNSQISYHNELGIKPNNNSFLSGEESVILTSGFNYTPVPDVNIFADADASNVLSHIGNPTYDDLEVHLGMRITFGGSTYWDPLGIVSGVVFKDKNGDGKYVPGDEGIAGVRLKVGDKEVVTDKNGRFRVEIRAKGVVVIPSLDTIPGGLIFSTPQSLNVKVVQGRTSKADFGLISQTGVYGIVFLDKGARGVPTLGDKFIGKVKITLDGQLTQKSDSTGSFYFRHVTPGLHEIAVDLNSVPINMVPLIKLKNEIDVAEGTNYMFNVPMKINEAEVQEK